MRNIFLGFGSNLSNREGNITLARELIRKIPGVRILGSSSLFETEPVGITDQPRFINAVVEIETSLPPRELLERVKEIERKIGRQKTFRWGPREIDIDILTYGNQTIHDDILTIPHPEMTKRVFVLLPLLEIAPEFVHPASNKTVRELLESLGEVKDSCVVKGPF